MIVSKNMKVSEKKKKKKKKSKWNIYELFNQNKVLF